jgi:hypothetical protein
MVSWHLSIARVSFQDGFHIRPVDDHAGDDTSRVDPAFLQIQVQIEKGKKAL